MEEVNLSSGVFIERGYTPIFIEDGDFSESQTFLIVNDTKKSIKLVYISPECRIFQVDSINFFGIDISEIEIIKENTPKASPFELPAIEKPAAKSTEALTKIEVKEPNEPKEIDKIDLESIDSSPRRPKPMYVFKLKYRTNTDNDQKSIKGILKICLYSYSIKYFLNNFKIFVQNNIDMINKYGFKKKTIYFKLSEKDFKFHKILEVLNCMMYSQTDISQYVPQKDNIFEERVNILIPEETNPYLIKLICTFYPRALYNAESREINYLKREYKAWLPCFESRTYEIEPDRQNELIDFIWKHFDYNQYMCYNMLDI